MAAMRSCGWHLVGLVALGLIGSSPAGLALPKKTDPIDPTKRAPISTAGAVRPAATPVAGNGVIGGRVIRMSKIPVNRASEGDDRATIAVRETRQKDRVIKPSARANTARRYDVRRASDRPAAIPRIDAERFQRMLREYEENRVPASAMLNGDVRVGGETLGIGDINRFVNPRAALEAQGIPVRSAGSGESAAPDSTTVPVSQDENGGSGSNARPAPGPTSGR